MNYSVLPPEINSGRIFAGAGSTPMLEASVAWKGLADELVSTAASFGSVTTTLAGQAWQGAASAAMSEAAAPYAAWLYAAAAQALEAAMQSKTLASLFEAARAAMALPWVVESNRDWFVRLVLSNLLGQNATAIATTEGQYEEFWAQDVAAMASYHCGASESASALPSWHQSLPDLPALA